MFGQINDAVANIVNLTGSRTIERQPLAVAVRDLIFLGSLSSKTAFKCGQHHPMGWDPLVYKKRERELSMGIHHFLFHDNGCHVTSCLKPLVP